MNLLHLLLLPQPQQTAVMNSPPSLSLFLCLNPKAILSPLSPPSHPQLLKDLWTLVDPHCWSWQSRTSAFSNPVCRSSSLRKTGLECLSIPGLQEKSDLCWICHSRSSTWQKQHSVFYIYSEWVRICHNDIISLIILIIIDRYESSQPAHSSSFLKSDEPPEFTPNGTTEEIDLFQNGVCQSVEGLTTPLCSRHLVGGKCWESYCT